MSEGMTMDAVLQEIVKTGKAAGASALVFKRGGEAYFGAFGEADLQSHTPFARDTIVRIYSMSKIVTTVTALACMERGLFNLDDPISRYIPEFTNMKKAVEMPDGSIAFVPAENAITIRQLFTMTSGITYPWYVDTAVERAVTQDYQERMKAFMARYAQGERLTTLDLVRSVADAPLLFEPGKGWHYGLSIDVIGVLVEVVTGKTLFEAMKEILFEPLGMHETFFRVPEELMHRVATIYTFDSQGKMTPYDYDPVWQKAPCDAGELYGIEMGGGGLFSTIDDMMRFARMLLGGGELDGVRILKRETVAEMTRRQYDAQNGPRNNEHDIGYRYALGVRVMERPEVSPFDECVGAFGWNGMAATSLRISPEDGQALVFFTQRIPSDPGKIHPPVVAAARAL